MHQIIVDPEFKALIPPLSAEERAQLEANLIADGCRDPLVVWVQPAPEPGAHKCYAHDESKCDLEPLDDVWHCRHCGHNPARQEYVLIDGHNRYEICTTHGIEFDTVEHEFASRDDAILWVVRNQFGRRNLSNFVRAELALRVKPLVEKKALANKQAAGGDRKSEQAKSLSQNSEKAIAPVHTDEELAKMAGVSRETIRKTEKIIQQASPELVEAVKSGELSINLGNDLATLEADKQRAVLASGKDAAKAVVSALRADKAEKKREERVAKIVEIAKGNAPLGAVASRYPVIYADPPWRYEHAETESRAIENHYPTMSLDEIKALPLVDIAHSDCVLFMWATSPKLAESMEVLSAWGFSYRTCAVWDKQKIGMGYYFRQQHELLLVAVRGEPPTPLPADRPASVFSYPRGQHSAKPVEVYELIEAMYPDFPKLEMFCRSPREGWAVWGNQSGGM